MIKTNNGFVYILSNQEYPGKYKIGKTKDDPVIRAKQLSRQTGAIGEFKVEWKKEVPDINIAESILHYKFREYHFEKEFFKLEVGEIKEIASEILNIFFKDEYEAQRIRMEARKRIRIRIKEMERERKIIGNDIDINDK